MKKNLLTFLSLVILMSVSFFVLESSIQTAKANVTPRYSNNPPGPQGQRTNQAVQCAGGGWIIEPGCCFGYENCYRMNPCDGAAFSCNGKDYIPIDDRDDNLNP